MLILEELTQQRLMGPLVDLVCVCVCMYVIVHMLGSDPTNGVVQHQKNGCGQLILVWLDFSHFVWK